MGEQTGIEWTDSSWSPWWGCVRVSPGCGMGKSVGGCYAEAWAKRTGHDVWGVAKPRRFFGDAHWQKPRVWERKARELGRQLRVFPSMCDPFEDRPDLVEPRERLGALVLETPHLDWQLLTKRPENMLRLAPACWGAEWPGNVWAMCTAEDQAYYDRRWPLLARVPARVRGISYEPAIGPLRLAVALDGTDCPVYPDWVIAGGESGGGPRPFNIQWVRDLAAQCRGLDTQLYTKQFGAAPMDGLVRLRLKDTRHGGVPAEWPAGDWPRDFPAEPEL